MAKAFYFNRLRSLYHRILREGSREAKRPPEGGSRERRQGPSDGNIPLIR
jgi:hypothetical protein